MHIAKNMKEHCYSTPRYREKRTFIPATSLQQVWNRNFICYSPMDHRYFPVIHLIADFKHAQLAFEMETTLPEVSTIKKNEELIKFRRKKQSIQVDKRTTSIGNHLHPMRHNKIIHFRLIQPDSPMYYTIVERNNV